MSKKRRKRRYRKEEKPKAETSQPSVDRRAMEQSLADVGRLLSEKEFDSIDEINAFLESTLASGQPISRPGRTPLEQAQDLMYKAWDTTGAQRVKLARQALSISADCADAYVLLAEETAKSIQEAKQLYEQGVEAGERALGPEAFDEAVGHFWGILETRPYMRARAGLAWCLSQMGEEQQAIAHYADLLRLNPSDNQGNRYLLADLLLASGDDEALKALLDQYEEDASAAWLYTRALGLYRQEGVSEAATAQLEEAISFNPFVPPYLLGKKRLPRQLPPYMGFGDKNEAVHYAAGAKAIWQKNEGALTWLRETVAGFDSGEGPA
ncbi:hypothetical protein ACFLYO_10585 [Chloroflexota bacterium]